MLSLKFSFKKRRQSPNSQFVTIRENEPSSILSFSLASISEPFCDYEGDDLISKMETSSIQIKCRVYHHKSFLKLRNHLGENDKQFIKSMMRCAVWNARGGKSGATFYKSHDSRFVLKQVRRRFLVCREFCTKFGP